LVGVEVNHDHCPPLHAHNGNEKEKGFIKNKVLETIVRKNVEKVTLSCLFMQFNQPLRIVVLGWCGANTVSMSHTK
jgi:hypothetical protein